MYMDTHITLEKLGWVPPGRPGIDLLELLQDGLGHILPQRSNTTRKHVQRNKKATGEMRLQYSTYQHLPSQPQVWERKRLDIEAGT